MLINKSPARLLEHHGITVRIYRLQQCYRVELSNREGKLYWYPGVFRSEQELWDWFKPQLEALIEEDIALSGKWMQSSEEELYQGWFIIETADGWEGYDPMTNHCNRASTLEELQDQINRIEANFSCS